MAEQAQAVAARIREHVQRTLANVIAVGKTLLDMKALLPHGEFGTWLRAEFGWTWRTACNLMNVAEQFGSKLETISNLSLAPTTAYLLAAPSTPAAARCAALALVEEGKPATPTIAKALIAQNRSAVEPGSVQGLPAEKLEARLEAVLKRFQEWCRPEGRSVMADRLIEFAQTLKSSVGGASSQDEGVKRRGRRKGAIYAWPVFSIFS